LEGFPLALALNKELPDHTERSFSVMSGEKRVGETHPKPYTALRKTGERAIEFQQLT
jgi:hypothetical protein